MMQDKSKREELKDLNGYSFSVTVDGILKNTHLMGCINTDSLHPEKARER